MTFRVNHLNKATGVTNVYEATAVWDKDKKQPRNKQVCIGEKRLDFPPHPGIISTTPPHALTHPDTGFREGLRAYPLEPLHRGGALFSLKHCCPTSPEVGWRTRFV